MISSELLQSAPWNMGAFFCSRGEIGKHGGRFPLLCVVVTGYSFFEVYNSSFDPMNQLQVRILPRDHLSINTFCMSLYWQIIDMLGWFIPYRKKDDEWWLLPQKEEVKLISLQNLAYPSSGTFNIPIPLTPEVGYEVKIIPRESKLSIIICDIDWVLADEHVRREKYLTTPKDYEGYYSDVSNDTHIPILWDLLKGKNVAFFTGRNESCRKQTLQWLDRRPYLKLDPKLLFMRPEGDFCHAKVLKYRFLHVLMSWWYKIDLAIDDNKDICRMYNFHNIPTLHCKFYDLDIDN